MTRIFSPATVCRPEPVRIGMNQSCRDSLWNICFSIFLELSDEIVLSYKACIYCSDLFEHLIFHSMNSSVRPNHFFVDFRFLEILFLTNAYNHHALSRVRNVSDIFSSFVFFYLLLGPIGHGAVSFWGQKTILFFSKKIWLVLWGTLEFYL